MFSRQLKGTLSIFLELPLCSSLLSNTVTCEFQPLWPPLSPIFVSLPWRNGWTLGSPRCASVGQKVCPEWAHLACCLFLRVTVLCYLCPMSEIICFRYFGQFASYDRGRIILASTRSWLKVLPTGILVTGNHKGRDFIVKTHSMWGLGRDQLWKEHLHVGRGLPPHILSWPPPIRLLSKDSHGAIACFSFVLAELS